MLPTEPLVWIIYCLCWQRNNLKDGSGPANENRALAKPEHTCRILDFSPMDQIHFASLRKYVAPDLAHGKQ